MRNSQQHIGMLEESYSNIGMSLTNAAREYLAHQVDVQTEHHWLECGCEAKNTDPKFLLLLSRQRSAQVDICFKM